MGFSKKKIRKIKAVLLVACMGLWLVGCAQVTPLEVDDGGVSVVPVKNVRSLQGLPGPSSIALTWSNDQLIPLSVYKAIHINRKASDDTAYYTIEIITISQREEDKGKSKTSSAFEKLGVPISYVDDDALLELGKVYSYQVIAQTQEGVLAEPVVGESQINDLMLREGGEYEVRFTPGLAEQDQVSYANEVSWVIKNSANQIVTYSDTMGYDEVSGVPIIHPGIVGYPEEMYTLTMLDSTNGWHGGIIEIGVSLDSGEFYPLQGHTLISFNGASQSKVVTLEFPLVKDQERPSEVILSEDEMPWEIDHNKVTLRWAYNLAENNSAVDLHECSIERFTGDSILPDFEITFLEDQSPSSVTKRSRTLGGLAEAYEDTTVKSNQEYTYSLKTRDVLDNESVAVTKTIQTPASNPTALFTCDSLNGVAPLEITCENESFVYTGDTLKQFLWIVLDSDGNNIASLTTTQAEPFSTSLSELGNYTVTLTCEDDDGEIETYSEDILVYLNEPPTASFTTDSLQGDTPLTVVFTNTSTAYGSRNKSKRSEWVAAIKGFLQEEKQTPEGRSGEIVWEQWDFGDGAALETYTTPLPETTSHTFLSTSLENETRNVTLTVKDIQGQEDTVTQTITITPEVVPSVNFEANQVGEGLTYQFTDLSQDPYLDYIVSWEWQFKDALGTLLETISYDLESIPNEIGYTFPEEGEFTVTLTVVDNDGHEGIIEKTIEVKGFPIALFSIDGVLNDKNTNVIEVSFNDLSSTFSGEIAQWIWGFGDGSEEVYSQEQPFNHSYTTSETYTVDLTIVADNGQSNSYSQSLMIFPPSAAFTAQQLTTQLVQFTDKSTAPPSEQCPDGYIADCSGDGDCVETFWLNDGVCDDQNQLWGVDLTCYENDGGDCDERIKKSTLQWNTINNRGREYQKIKGKKSFILSETALFQKSGSIVSWEWDFGDGVGVSAVQNPTYSYVSTGNYTVELVITDTQGYKSQVRTKYEFLEYECVNDFDEDEICDEEDPDQDNDLVLNEEDSDPFDPFKCKDEDLDQCDDCSSGSNDSNNDGDDFDQDGACNSGDTDDDNDGAIDIFDDVDDDPLQCKDTDVDGCDDCSSGQFNPNNDGDDLDGDGACDTGDEWPECSDSGVDPYDECGLCLGSGIAEGACDCEGNPPETACLQGNIVCTEEECFQYYQEFLDETGISQSISILGSISTLEIGDEIGVFDSRGQTSNGTCDSFTGDVFVGGLIWKGVSGTITAVGSSDACESEGAQKPGYIIGNTAMIRIWRPSENKEYFAIPQFSSGEGVFGEAVTAITEISLLDPPLISINEFFVKESIGASIPDYVELINAGAETQDLTGWKVNNLRLDYGEIEPGGFVLIANADVFYNDQGDDLLAGSNLEGSILVSLELLQSRGEIIVENNYGVIIDRIYYDEDTGWPVGEANRGYAVELKSPIADNQLPDYWGLALEVPQSPYMYNIDASVTNYGSPLATNTVFEEDDLVIFGCPYSDACNYNEIVTYNDGSCIYPEENYNCLGICVTSIDCAGVCGGEALLDNCGQCFGGESGAEFNTNKDCNGDCFGTAFLDDCDRCVEGNTNSEENSDKDCNGECFGTAFLDDCDRCVEGNTNSEENSDKDCNGDCFGTADLDTCGICSEGNTAHESDSDIDCNGDCFGIAFLDECGVCGGGESGHLPNSDRDCTGVCFGSAIIDDCNLCSGSTTGHEANSDKDCAGTCFGIAFLDECETCVGGDSGQEENQDKDCEGNCFGPAVIDNCGFCSEGTTGHSANSDQDCDEVCFGVAILDDCEVCSGGTTGHVAEIDKDCNEDCFGEALIDACGECSGGNTGSEYGVNTITYFPDTDDDGLGSSGLNNENGVQGQVYCLGEGALGLEGWVTNADDEYPECSNEIGENPYDACENCHGSCEFNEDQGIIICGEDSETVIIADCAGVCNGLSEVDVCGICNGDDTSCNRPVAIEKSVETEEDIPITIELEGTDPNEDPTQAEIVLLPDHGTVTLSGKTVLYEPEDNYSGEDKFEFTLTDGLFTSFVTPINITIEASDDPPVATPITIAIDEDQATSIELIGSDQDTEDESLSIEIVESPSLGEVIQNRYLEILTYVPEKDSVGQDSLSYKVFDGQQYSNEALVTILINPVDDAPIIVDPQTDYELNEGESLDLQFTIIDVDTSQTQLEIWQEPFYGTIENNNGDGSFRYISTINYVGTDMFSIRALSFDDQGEETLSSEIIPIEISVKEINKPPKVFDISSILIEDKEKEIQLRSEDSEEDTIQYEIVNLPSHGTLQLNGDKVTYLADFNFNGEDFFDYKAIETDTEEGYESETLGRVSLTIVPENDTPIATPITVSKEMLEDVLDIAGNISDQDGDPMSVTFMTEEIDGKIATLFGGELERLGETTFQYTQTSDTLRDVDILFYKASDGVSESGIKPILWELSSTARELRGEVIAFDQAISAQEGIAQPISLIGLDSEYGFSETASIDISIQPTKGVLISLNTSGNFIADGMVSWDYLYLPNPTSSTEDTLFDSITYRINNPNNTENTESNSAEISIAIQTENNNPTVSDIEITVQEDVETSIPLIAIDSENDDVEFYIVTPPNSGELTIEEGNAIYIPEKDKVGSDFFQYNAKEVGTEEENFSENIGTVTLQILAVNDKPIVLPFPNQIISETESLTLSLSAIDSDGDTEFTFQGTEVSQYGDDNWSIEGNQLHISPSIQEGDIQVEVIADDGHNSNNLSDPILITVTIENSNDSPSIQSIEDTGSLIEDSGSIVISVVPEDPDPNDILSLTVESNNLSLFPSESIVIDKAEGESEEVVTLTCTPIEDQFGESILFITVSDGMVSRTTQHKIIVEPDNDAPSLMNLTEKTIIEEGVLYLNLAASDKDNNVSELSYQAQAENATIEVIENQLIIFPAINFTGEIEVLVTVSDGDKGDEGSFILTVLNKNDPPQIISIPLREAILYDTRFFSSPFEYTYQLEIEDPDSEAWDYTLVEGPVGMSISSSGLVLWTPSEQKQEGVTLQVTDEGGASRSQSFTITTYITDCAGEIAGQAIVDECGRCSGGTSGAYFNEDKDCLGECFGAAVIDTCGVCSGGTTGHEENSDKDCAGICFGNGFLDECGICSGSISDHKANSDKDCIGQCFGPNDYDECGVCSGPDTDHEENSDKDLCGICFGNNDTCLDCNGDSNGSASLDGCGQCSGGLTSIEPNTSKDCLGLCFGNAALDECGECTGGTTGNAVNSAKDSCGVCFGDNSTCSGCMDSEACNYDDGAIVDDDSCDYPEVGFNCEGECVVALDCLGVCGGTSVEDVCGVCGGVGVPTGFCDCNDNVLDDCGICDGVGAIFECGCFDIAEGECDCFGSIIDECGICNGGGIPPSDCDCAGNILDECGVCDGSGIPSGACDCDGNVSDECGVCNGSGPLYDCEDGDELVCSFSDCLGLSYFSGLVPTTGVFQNFIFQSTIQGLDPGDEIGVFDLNGITNSGNCNSEIGEVLVGAAIWTGDQLALSTVGSVDNCSIGATQLAGYISGNPVMIRVWKQATNFTYTVIPTFSSGSGIFGEPIAVVSDIILEELPTIVINEFFFRSAPGTDVPDYIELYNQGTQDINLVGWSINDQKIEEENSVIKTLEYYLISTNDPFYDSEGTGYVVGTSLPTSSYVDVNLPMEEGKIELRDNNGALMDSIEYSIEEEWPVGVDNRGYAAELVSPLLDNSQAINWERAEDSHISTYLFNVESNGLRSFGSPLAINTVSVGALGCTQSSACNYNEEALVNDGSCVLPETNFNCDGECILDIDCAEVCGGSLVFDACGICGGNSTDCTVGAAHFNLTINATGIAQPVIFQMGISLLQTGDEIAIYDSSGRLNSDDCSSQTGEVLVATGIWEEGSQLTLGAIGSIDVCSFGGFQYPGYIEGNAIVIKVWDESEQIEYNATPIIVQGQGEFGDIFTVINELIVE